MFKRKCKITFISHGATLYSLDGIINDSIKSPKINDLGEEEIKKVCDYLKKRDVAYDKIYSSPYASCVESANIISKLFRKKVIVKDLKSRNHGDWQGSTYMDLYKEYGENVIYQTPNNGESIKDFNKRVSVFIKTLVEENLGNRIILVTTPEIIRAVVSNVLNITTKNQYKILIKTGSITQVSYFDNWASIIYMDYNPL